MPTTRKRIARVQADWLTQTHIDWLYGDPFDRDNHDWLVYDGLDIERPNIVELDTLDPPRPMPFLESAVTGRRLWKMYGAELVEEHIGESPGTRPMRWWQFEAPEPRQRVGGVGTPAHERLAYDLELYLGVPVHWITESDLQSYRLINSPLDVPALDPSDPPMFEAEAAYLDRLQLLVPGERKRLRKADFEPDSVFDLIEFESDEDVGAEASVE